MSSSGQRRGPAPRLSSLSDFRRLSEDDREARSYALRVLAAAREGGTTIEAAAAEAEVSVAEVRYWAGEALEPTRQGRTLPRASDRLLRLRPLMVEGEAELVFVAVQGSQEAERADSVFDVQWRYATGETDQSELHQIEGVQIAGRTVESDPVRLRYSAAAGLLDADEVYRALVG